MTECRYLNYLVGVSVPSILRPVGTHLYLNKLCLLLNVARENAHHGKPLDISTRGCWKGLIIGFCFVFGNFGKDLKKQILL